MRKINELLREMTVFLEGNDHTKSTHFQTLAEEYATVCSDVSAELENCRKMIDSGLALQAMQHNHHFTPALTERAHMLMFPGRTKWVSLCTLYQYPVPDSFDMPLIEKLESPEFSRTVENMADLQLQWRTLARTGSNHEKTILLRKMVKLDSGTGVWRKNLETVEHAWLLEMQEAARKAQTLGDLPALYALFTRMTSPELLHPAPKSMLEEFAENVNRYKQEQMAKKQESTLQEICAAYDQKQIDALQKSLGEWKNLSADPLFVSKNADTLQVEEAERLLHHLITQRDTKKRIAELKALLQKQMNESAEYPEIEKVFSELQSLDKTAITPVMQERFTACADSYKFEQHRRHVRALLLWVLLAVFAAGATVFTVITVQRSRKAAKVCAEMEKLVQEQSPEKALKYYEELAAQDKALAAHENILAAREKAEKAVENRANDMAAYDRLLTKAGGFLSPEKIDSEEAEAYFTEIENFKGEHSREQEVSFADLQAKRLELQRAARALREQQFREQIKAFTNTAFELDSRMNNPENLDTALVSAEILQLEQKFNAYLAECAGTKLDKEMLEQEREAFQQIKKNLLDKAGRVEDYQRIFKKVMTPKTFKEYASGMEESAEKAPEIAVQFRAGREQTEQLILHGKLADKPELLLQEGLLQKDPYFRDAAFIMAGPDALSAVKSAILGWKNDLADWKYYELVLSGKGKKYYFYFQSQDDVRLERAGGQAGGAYRTLLAKIRVSETRTCSVLFKIQKEKSGTYELLQDQKKSEYMLPEKISGISSQTMNMLANAEMIPEAAHYRLMVNTVDKLQRLKTIQEIEDAIYDEFQTYLSRHDMNPVVKVFILNKLLSIYGEISEYTKICAERITELLGSSQITEPWMAPDAVIKSEHVLKKTEKFAVSDEFRALRKTANLTQEAYTNVFRKKPVPFGVLHVANGKVSAHFFDGVTPAGEFFVTLELNGAANYYLLPESVLKQKNTDLKSLPVPLNHIQNGMLILGASGAESMSAQILPETDFPSGETPNVFRIPASLPLVPAEGDQP